MAIFQGFHTHGNKLTFCVGRSARLGIPFYRGRPKEVVFAQTAGVDFIGDIFILNDGNPLSKGFVVVDGTEIMAVAHLGVFRYPYQILQYLLLYLIGVFGEQLNLVDALF